MPPLIWTGVYGGLTAIAVTMSWRRSDDARVAGALLTTAWAVTNASYYAGLHNAFYPVMDATFAMVLAWLWREHLAAWKVLLIVLFLGQLGAHVLFVHTWDGTRAARYVYDLALNLMYLGQLALLALATRRSGV